MQLIKGRQADAELEKVEMVEGLEAATDTFPLTDLSPVDFERLNYALFKSSSPPGSPRNWNDAALMLAGADAGRDVLLLADEGACGVVQCKRLSTAMTLPAFLRELSKCILFCTVDASLPSLCPHTHYFLSLTRDPASTVVNFFAQPLLFLNSHPSDVYAAVKDTLESYSSLHALDFDEAVSTVHQHVQSMTLHLIRPVDLNSWLAQESDVAGRFFRHRVVVDRSPVMDELADIRESVEEIVRQTSGISAITDEDVMIIKDYIDGIPESHRTSLGFASLFGFPKEMFSGKENFQKLLKSLMETHQIIHSASISWMSARAEEEATRICDLSEIRTTVHPFALQIAVSYMKAVAADISLRSLCGEAIWSRFKKETKEMAFTDEEDRLAHVCEQVLEQGRRHLAHGYSQRVGDDEQVKLKRQTLGQLMANIPDKTTLEEVVQVGRRNLEPHLKKAALRLGELGGYRTGVFLAGANALDSDIGISKMIDTARKLGEFPRSRRLWLTFLGTTKNSGIKQPFGPLPDLCLLG